MTTTEYVDSIKEITASTLTTEQRKSLEDYQQKQNIDEIVKKVVNENSINQTTSTNRTGDGT